MENGQKNRIYSYNNVTLKNTLSNEKSQNNNDKLKDAFLWPLIKIWHVIY